MAPFFTRRLGATAAGCFAVGAGMELFMIKTGFCARKLARLARAAPPLARGARPAGANENARAGL
jgi:hypothetical protein